jgi:hypothetical protein
MKINYVNSTMDELIELQTELYEALCDGTTEEVLSIIKRFKQVLTDIQKSQNEEVR